MTAQGIPEKTHLAVRGAAAQGETWSVDANGERYQRWWGEDHFGNGWVRKHGNSNTGERSDRVRVST